MQIEVTNRWHNNFPDGHVGILLMEGVDNTQPAPTLDIHKREMEKTLRSKYADFSRKELIEINPLNAYRTYYKKFNKTYHVQLQLESIVLKGKSLPNVSPLVDATFAAELETLVLTASHDVDLLEGPLTIDATQGTEQFTQMNGTTRTLKPNDMMMQDAKGVICTIIYGQDNRTPISAKTTRALYVAYAPPGVPATLVQQQLDAIRDNILLFAPEASTEMVKIFSANG